jgi:hypothetical protein
MNRRDFLELWRSHWDGEGWIASWKKGLEKVSSAQAAWKPAPERHSVWQNVNHVIFWRKYTKAVADGTAKPTSQDVERENFAEPRDTGDSAWRQALADLEKSHRDIEAIIADESKPIDRVQMHLAHDAYHMGQIQQLLALQGMSPVL